MRIAKPAPKETVSLAGLSYIAVAHPLLRSDSSHVSPKSWPRHFWRGRNSVYTWQASKKNVSVMCCYAKWTVRPSPPRAQALPGSYRANVWNPQQLAVPRNDLELAFTAYEHHALAATSLLRAVVQLLSRWLLLSRRLTETKSRQAGESPRLLRSLSTSPLG